VAIHQWIGILCGLLAAYHLFIHRDWVGAVSKRFFGKTSGQARMHYALDALLLLGFVLIGVTGLVISTWLNLPLSDFTTWLNIHITISIATLVTLLLKLVWHWRWIVRTTCELWTRSVMAPATNAVVRPAKAGSGMGRREFLQVMGVVGAASFVALVNASRGLTESIATPTEDVALQNASNTIASSNQSSPLSSNSSCTVRCGKNCSYPGHCHRYVDTNNNGRCDLSECI
jgi:hypothetical protein